MCVLVYPPYGGPPPPADPNDPQAQYQSWQQYAAPPPGGAPGAQPLNALQPAYYDPSQHPPAPYGAPQQGWRPEDNAQSGGFAAPPGQRDYTMPREGSRFDRGSRDSR